MAGFFRFFTGPCPGYSGPGQISLWSNRSSAWDSTPAPSEALHTSHELSCGSGGIRLALKRFVISLQHILQRRKRQSLSFIHCDLSTKNQPTKNKNTKKKCLFQTSKWLFCLHPLLQIEGITPGSSFNLLGLGFSTSRDVGNVCLVLGLQHRDVLHHTLDLWAGPLPWMDCGAFISAFICKLQDHMMIITID